MSRWDRFWAWCGRHWKALVAALSAVVAAVGALLLRNWLQGRRAARLGAAEEKGRAEVYRETAVAATGAAEALEATAGVSRDDAAAHGKEAAELKAKEQEATKRHETARSGMEGDNADAIAARFRGESR